MIKNYEMTKLAVESASFSFFSIYLLLFIIACCFVKKKEAAEGELLSRKATDELRGIGILFVIVGHIAIHVVEPKMGSLAFSDFGVSLFFILSGYGLTRSYTKKAFNFKEFIWRRLSRVLIPYWIATLFIIILDYVILKRQYSPLDLGLTLSGVNFSIAARHIDYVRWYITALILWYSIFAVCWANFSKKSMAFVMPLLGLVLFIINYYWLHLGYAFFSFPAGVVLGLHLNRIKERIAFYNKNKLLIIVCLGLVFPYLFMQHIIPEIIDILPYIFIEFIKEILWIVFVSCLIIVLSIYTTYISGFLIFLGDYSYELFLFHGAFMIKYDFILFRGPLYLSFWPYLAFIVVVCVLINKYIFSRIQKCILKIA